MQRLNFRKICQDLTSKLPKRQKEIILRRFGLDGAERETLQAIGDDLGITRERVRQIQEDAFKKIRKKLENYRKIFSYFEQYLKKFGGLRRENILLKDLGDKKWGKEVYFLLTLDGKFKRYTEKKDHYPFWTLSKDFVSKAKKTIDALSLKLKEKGKPLELESLNFSSFEKPVLISYLQISKKIQENEEGLYGLREWPEINPRGIKDKAYLVLKKVKKPLHFTEITKLIEGSHLQTVHNELIRDSRFVLIGRGIYALKKWGYEPGLVKDVIIKILKENGPMKKNKILKNVLRRRIVKENTILLNLSNKKYFLRDSQGKYNLRPELI
ncbi:hypothetical protein AMJ49_03025 [Parcubacteria bacterium DG_74_2]|nr:MAG: hypothetical protein AMJ49_03025 [Parcubacteria bacterium DG_74_2]